MRLETVERVLNDDLQRVEERLLERTASAYEFVDLAVQHVISGGGKRLRPALLLLSAKALGYDGDKAHELAAAMELIHVGSLVHDDVIDEAAMRRNRETLNAKFGNKVAVLVGDYMHARVLSILAGSQPEILRVVADATQAMCEGEVIGAYKASDFDLELGDYYRIIELKTAKLIAASCAVGALLATDDPAKRDAMNRYGNAVGTAFQIVDDILDLVGETAKFGKPTRNDLREGKITLPVMHTRDHCAPDERRELQRLFAKEERSPDDIARIVALTERYRAVDAAFRVVDDFSRQAKDALAVLEPSPAKDALVELVDYLAERDT